MCFDWWLLVFGLAFWYLRLGCFFVVDWCQLFWADWWLAGPGFSGLIAGVVFGLLGVFGLGVFCDALVLGLVGVGLCCLLLVFGLVIWVSV